MKHLSQQTTNDREVPHQGCCAFKLRHYTALRRHTRHGGRCGGCGHFLSVMSGALSSCCGEYRSIPANSRTVVPIGAANSVHTLLLTVKKQQKLYVFVQLLMKYVRVKIKIIYIHKWRAVRSGNITGNYVVSECVLQPPNRRCFIQKYDYPFSTPTKNAVNKRIIERHTPTTLSSVKPPFLWCVSGIITFKNMVILLKHRTITIVCGERTPLDMYLVIPLLLAV